MKLRKYAWVIWVVGAIALIAAGTYWRLHDSGESDESEGLPAVPEGGSDDVSASETFSTALPIPVEGAEVVLDTLVVSVSAAAQAAAERSAALLAQVEGPVLRVRVRENQSVSAGQVLLEIDTTEYALQVRGAEARVATTEATYRELILFDEEIDDPEVRAERERVARAKSGLDGALVELEQARLRLERTTIRAPYAGRVANLRVVAGQWVGTRDELLTAFRTFCQERDAALRVAAALLKQKEGSEAIEAALAMLPETVAAQMWAALRQPI